MNKIILLTTAALGLAAVTLVTTDLQSASGGRPGVADSEARRGALAESEFRRNEFAESEFRRNEFASNVRNAEAAG